MMPTGPYTRTWTGAAGDGDLANQANYVPSDYPITSADALVFNSGSLTITNDFTAHSITLNNSTKLRVVAKPADGPCDPASLYAAATVITLPGGLFLDGSSALTIESDLRTGATARFDVGDFSLGQNATVNAKKLGWGWFDGDDPRTVAAIARTLENELDALTRKCQALGVEPFGFAMAAAALFPTMADWTAFDWRAWFSRAEVTYRLRVEKTNR